MTRRVGGRGFLPDAPSGGAQDAKYPSWAWERGTSAWKRTCLALALALIVSLEKCVPSGRGT